MSVIDNSADTFSIRFDTENAFICGIKEGMETVAKRELTKLNAEGKTVYITDPYLFASHDDVAYETELLEILKGLKAKEIHYCTTNLNGSDLYNNIKTKLEAEKCILTQDLFQIDCHDRFWLCKESGKAVIFGTSLNGLCKKVCRIDELYQEEVVELMQVMKDAEISI